MSIRPSGNGSNRFAELRKQATSLVAGLAGAESVMGQLLGEVESLGEQCELYSNLFVLVERLHSTQDVRDVMGGVVEILTGIVGTEDFAIHLRDGDSASYERAVVFGPEAARQGATPVALGTRLEVTPSGERPLILPLRDPRARSPVAVVTVARLLAHKRSLNERDHRLLAALGSHAGIALERALALLDAEARRVSTLRAVLVDLMPEPLSFSGVGR